ncbi:OmpH family outer membrane protein [Aridibaculum aurantiacum]|uniref:OmpH family outer membrane protein n=1 Tax=Aridibaculum aurantiacum TaxID=2810307 RepID=UPI001A957B8F|nr:OmpH family outer membrane protein [Aridibaculum aurantiacum]
MKNFLLPLNIILVIAVAVLFYLHFSSGKKTTTQVASQTSGSAQTGAFKLAYFEMDSIDNNYEYLKDVRSQLKSKQQELGGQLNQLKNRYMEKVKKYQQEAPTMTQERANIVEQELMNDQKVLANKEQSLDLEMQDIQFKKMQDVNKKIEEFLKEYNKDKGFSYIVANQPGTVYYVDPGFDITAEVVKGLNEQYKKKD